MLSAPPPRLAALAAALGAPRGVTSPRYSMRHASSLPLLLVLSAVAACADAPSSPPTALAPTSSAAASLADAPARATSMPVLFFVTGGPPTYAAVTPMSPASTLLWDLRGKMPVIAPDGHQVMLGEYLMATGHATDKCINGATHTVLHFSGLLPSATYTVWQLAYTSPGAQADPGTNLIGLGAAGPNDGSGNAFRTSASGEGDLSVVTPPGPLSLFGVMGACALDQAEVQYIAAYHFDGLTHGGTPGPDGTFAEQVGFSFKGR